jgi:hypothetical protein
MIIDQSSGEVERVGDFHDGTAELLRKCEKGGR